jgi:hypothetical protein
VKTYDTVSPESGSVDVVLFSVGCVVATVAPSLGDEDSGLLGGLSVGVNDHVQLGGVVYVPSDVYTRQ